MRLEISQELSGELRAIRDHVLVVATKNRAIHNHVVHSRWHSDKAAGTGRQIVTTFERAVGNGLGIEDANVGSLPKRYGPAILDAECVRRLLCEHPNGPLQR